MNQYLKPLYLILIVLFLASCAPAASEPAAELPLVDVTRIAEQTTNMAPALKPVAPLPASEEDNMTAEEQTNLPESPDDDAEVITSGPVEPVTVDLSQITPQVGNSDVLATMPAPRVPDELVALVAKVSQDLAERLQIDVSQIVLISSQAVEWRDSSLGCPEPGMMYMTVITPGYRLVLSANGELFEYHTGRNDLFVFCPDITPGAPSPGTDS